LAKRVGVIDIGSNSVRMVVYEKTSRFSFHILHECKSAVRISEDAYKNGGNLQEIPMKRAFEALDNFLNIINSFKARKTLCVATSALRDAPNKKEFLQKVKNKLGLKIKIIDGQKESYFGAVACANLLPSQDNALSIDIGGGSTEFSTINDKNISSNISLKLGTVRLKELFFDKGDIKGAKEYIDKELKNLDSLNPSTVIGIGGTFRAVSAAIMASKNYPFEKLHAFELSNDEFSKYLDSILSAKNEAELKELHIKKNRLDIIKPGAIILSRILKKFSIKKLITSGVGVREGVYLSDMLRNSKHKLPQNYNLSVRYILDLHVDNKAYSNQLNKLVKNIFDLSYKYLGLDEAYRYELSVAAKLFTSGANMHFFSQHKHNYHLLQNSLEYGFTHKQTMLIATLSRYAARKNPSASHAEKYKELLPDINSLNKLNYLLSLSISLLKHRPRNINFKLDFEDDTLKVISQNNLYLAKESVKKLDYINPLKVEFIYS
jgi:exopolyphosphatase/guanosine-5'-triphosphate,3'-diphosphate pyrophosphatase